ncbi:MAG: zinc ABC transporter solute-binding protein [Gammaproteobacteria bacterium]|nr:zinc ABC transporter solute-binding protein [Gammaproteobacteria bacterium]
MKNILRSTLLAALLACCAFPAQAALRILATTPEWASLAEELGGDKVDVYAATTALQDAHRVEAKPSLIARARRADLVIATGAQLEIGWLPLLLRESGNARVQPGQPGYFEAAQQVKLREIPASVDRSMGDVHPFGNPHIHLDPRNVGIVAAALGRRLAQVDPANAAHYQARASAFEKRWVEAVQRWQARAANLRGVPVAVIHRDQVYLCGWLGLQEVAAIEPKPGVPPSAGYLAQLVAKLKEAPPRMILRNTYNDTKAVNWLSERIGVPVVTLPYTVGGTPEAKDLFGLFDDTLRRLGAT